MARSTVAILKTQPSTIIDDYHALLNLARLRPGSLALGGDEHRARPMREQVTEVAVPVSADPTETPAMPTGVLAWGEPQATGKLARPSEGADTPHGPDQGRRGQEPNAGNLAQASCDRIGVGQGPQVALECRDSGLDGANLVAHARQHVRPVQRQQQLCVFQDRGDGLQGGARPRRAATTRVRARSHAGC